MILVVSPNLCLDRIVTIPGFRAGVVWRADAAVEVAGGKGMNVTRALTALGESAVLVGFAGGGTGRALRDHATADGVSLDAVMIAAASRVCVHVLDPGQPETVINEPGPTVTRSDVAHLRERVMARLGDASVVVLTGSLPPGCPTSLYPEIIRAAGKRPVIVDATGEPLRRALSAAPAIAKCNRDELRATFGLVADSAGAAAAAARVIATRGAASGRGAAVVVTLGADGAVGRESGADALAYHVAAPAVRRVNAIGAGDTLTAGLAAGVRRGWTLRDALAYGVAAAASDVETLIPGLPDPGVLAAVRAQVAVGLL